MTPELESSRCGSTWARQEAAPGGSGFASFPALLWIRQQEMSPVPGITRLLLLVSGEIEGWKRFQLQNEAGFVSRDPHPAFPWGKGELDETHSDSCRQPAEHK